jgi:hypothetical protein
MGHHCLLKAALVHKTSSLFKTISLLGYLLNVTNAFTQYNKTVSQHD